MCSSISEGLTWESLRVSRVTCGQLLGVKELLLEKSSCQAKWCVRHHLRSQVKFLISGKRRPPLVVYGQYSIFFFVTFYKPKRIWNNFSNMHVYQSNAIFSQLSLKYRIIIFSIQKGAKISKTKETKSSLE